MLFRKLIRLLTILLLIVSTRSVNAQTITDTIFYNPQWQICEAPVATYYRIGTMMIDSNWYYTGPFKDYNMAGTLLMEGNYSADGKKDGPFIFYDTDGYRMATGNYSMNNPSGDWEWTFTNGVTRAKLHFPEDPADFAVTYFKDNTGNVLLENGNGKFVWKLHAFEDVGSNYSIEGEFKNGKRSGTWDFYRGDERNVLSRVCQEIYNKEGGFKKGRLTGRYNQPIERKCFRYDFVPVTLKVTEAFYYDRMFMKGADSSSNINVLNYLLNRKSIDIIIKNKKYEEAILYVLKDLESNRSKIDYKSKDINGKISFKIGDNAMPEDITVTGDNLSDKEKDFLIYLMSKYKNIEMPMDGTIGFEGYHTIYFFSLDIRKYMPVSLRQYAGMELFFTMMPKNKYEMILEANKKKIKKAMRSEMMFYW